MDNNQWAITEIDKLIKRSPQFTDQATLMVAKELIQEQSKRIQQSEDELDGRIWSPNKW